MPVHPLYKAGLFICLNLCLIYLVYINSETTGQTQLPWREEDDPNPARVPGPDPPLIVGVVAHEGGPSAVNARPNAPPSRRGLQAEQPALGDLATAVAAVEAAEENISTSLSLGISEGSMLPSTATGVVTMDPDLAAALLDSSEIDLGDRVVPTLYSPGRKLRSLEDFDQLMTYRVRKIQHTCEHIRENQKKNPVLGRLPPLHPDVFYVLKNLDLIWCPVYKAASTNWMHNLLYLSGLTDNQVEEIKKKYDRQPNDQARVVAPLLPRKELDRIKDKQSSRKLIVVRHPFDRLVSAFRDKLERCHGPENCTLENDWYYTQYGRSIVTTYRAAAEARFSKEFFSEKNNFGAPLSAQQTWRSAAFPTWWEFIQFILDTSPSRYDEHWKPASLYCSICAFPYNYVLHFEDIQQEEQLFARKMGMENVIRSRWENRNDEGLRKEEVVARYFDMLDDDDILALYDIYQDDFKMFGYQFQFRGLRLNMP